MPDLSTTLCVSDAAASITPVSTTTFACDTCYDTGEIDYEGRVTACPDCTIAAPDTITIRISGLGHGLGADGRHYETAVAWTASSITFEGTKSAIRADVRRVRAHAVVAANIAGYKGRTRNSISSGAIAIDNRVSAELAKS